ncbi:MAG: aspartyl-tRNA(Asn)/glutamyl-tRNA (Gln) amidotransferase subunit A [Parcubacteria group bacterium Gr01-1014_31]|nr:MAG: aspartyl-tRNA(Asn)/glutamyl-tRNA (Gln) amidotransferase subunit A [Parcubacteria group bacterium Gr01-1014_31]
MAHLTELTLRETNAGLRSREFSSRDLTVAYLARIAQVEGALHAFLSVAPEQAVARAVAYDKSGEFSNPLAGIPIALKDNLCVTGTKTTAASKILADYVATYDATVATRLQQAGAVVLGKTNLDEFACGSSTEHSAFGPTKNPWDVTRVPGGSSGGSAAAVAAGEACVALGSDTGGSIRQPASLCGVVGLKPTYGRVSRYGLLAMASSLDQIGPFARSVGDAAAVLQAIAGQDPLDATTSPRTVPDFSADLERPMKGMKIGVPKEYFSEHTVAGVEPGVKESFEAALKQLERLGATLVYDLSLPHTDYALAVYYVIVPAELSSNLARYDGVRFGLSRREQDTLIAQYGQTRGEGLGPEIRRRVMLGTYALSAGYYDAYYRKAQQVRTLVRQDFERAFQQVDCLVTPTSPTVAFKIGARANDPLAMYLSDVYTVAANVAGVPGLSLPCGLAPAPDDASAKLPVGLQLIGKSFDEALLLRVGHQLEKTLHFKIAPTGIPARPV